MWCAATDARDRCCGSWGPPWPGRARRGLRCAAPATRRSPVRPDGLVLPSGTAWAFLDDVLLTVAICRDGDVAELLPHYRGSVAFATPAFFRPLSALVAGGRLAVAPLAPGVASSPGRRGPCRRHRPARDRAGPGSSKTACRAHPPGARLRPADRGGHQVPDRGPDPPFDSRLLSHGHPRVAAGRGGCPAAPVAVLRPPLDEPPTRSGGSTCRGRGRACGWRCRGGPCRRRRRRGRRSIFSAYSLVSGHVESVCG